MEKEILTIKEVADYLRVKTSTIYRWAEQGEIPHSRIGRILRFRKSELDRWFDSQQAPIKSRRVFAPITGHGHIAVDRLVEKVIDAEASGRYTHRKQREPDKSRPKEEVSHGA